MTFYTSVLNHPDGRLWIEENDPAGLLAAAPLGGGDALPINSVSQWARLRTRLAEMERALAAEEAAEAADEAQQAQRGVDLAEALAARACAHAACTTVAASVAGEGAAEPKPKRCSGCLLVRYCGAACQKADWRAHKAACKEVQARRAA